RPAGGRRLPRRDGGEPVSVAPPPEGARPLRLRRGEAPQCAPLLAVQDLDAGYGRSQVLFGVTMEVRPGEIVGLLGRNGMGKTTLVHAVTQLLPPWSGSVRWHDAPIAGRPAHLVARLGIALVPEGRQVFPNLSVEEHLTAFARP